MLTRQMEAVIIEVCTVQVLRLRADPQQMHEAKYLTPTNGTNGQAGFHTYQAIL